jgi:chromosome segregation ATPase
MAEEQLRKRIEWLDELRRKDAETITRLNERVARLESQLETQQKQMQEQMAELARFSGQVGRIEQFEGVLDRTREEISQLVESIEKRMLKRMERAADKVQNERGEINKTFEQLRSRLITIEELENQMIGRIEEETRLNRELELISARLQGVEEKNEAVEQRIVALVERVGTGEKRIADLQAQSEEARTRIEQAVGRVDLTEDRLRRLDQTVKDLGGRIEDQEQALMAWEEKYELRMVEFDHAWKDWLARMEKIQELAAQLDEQMREVDESQRSMKQLRAELEKTLERLERRISEVTEMHRLNEERFQREWAAFQADDQRRWSGFRLEREEAWRAHERIHQRLEDTLSAMEETLADATAAINLHTEQMQKRVMDLLNMVREWGEEIQLLSRQSGS